MQPQPFILVNPSDIGSFQQANFLAAAAAATATGGGGMIPGISPSLAGGGGGGGGGGYIIVPSGAFPTSPFVTFTGAGNQSGECYIGCCYIYTCMYSYMGILE